MDSNGRCNVVYVKDEIIVVDIGLINFIFSLSLFGFTSLLQLSDVDVSV